MLPTSLLLLPIVDAGGPRNDQVDAERRHAPDVLLRDPAVRGQDDLASGDEGAGRLQLSLDRGDEPLAAPAGVDREHQQQLEVVEERLDRRERRARIERDAADDAASGEALQDAVRVPRRLDVEADDARARVDVRRDLLERLVDHHVDVHERDARLVERGELLTEPQQVGGEHADAQPRAGVEQLARRRLHQACTAAPDSSWKSSYASSGRASSCTTFATAWIIAGGESDWKMLRPMSTPAAPSCTARYAISSASSSGSFLPPAITTGTGQPAVTFSKPSPQ